MTSVERVKESNESSERLGPSIFPRLPLHTLCDINPRRTPAINRADDEITSFVPMTAVDERSGTISERLVRPFAEVRKGYTYFEDGDVIFAKITPCMQNGKHSVCRELVGGFGFGSTEFHVLRPGPRLLAEWLHFYLRQPWLLEDARRHFTGAVGQQRLPEDYLRDLEIPLPSIQVQSCVVKELQKMLAAAERAQRAAEQRLAAVKALRESYLRETFNGNRASSWEQIRIGDVSHIQTGFAFKSESFREEGVRILRNANVHQGFIEWKDVVRVSDDERVRFANFDLHEGDIILTLDRPLVANGLKAARLSASDTPALLNQRVARFILDQDRMDSDFFYAFLRSPSFVHSIKGHDQSLGVPHISPGQVAAVPIPLPCVDEQRRISAELQSFLAEQESLNKWASDELCAIELLPASLLRNAFERGLTTDG